MRVNVYSQELTEEVLVIKKASNTGIEYKAVQFILHSSKQLHHPPEDDDRSAVTFWMPQSRRGLKELLNAFSKAISIVSNELHELETREFAKTYDANARRRGQYDT